jgi:hypothetical protein
MPTRLIDTSAWVIADAPHVRYARRLDVLGAGRVISTSETLSQKTVVEQEFRKSEPAQNHHILQPDRYPAPAHHWVVLLIQNVMGFMAVHSQVSCLRLLPVVPAFRLTVATKLHRVQL